jgi:hypothetical protein
MLDSFDFTQQPLPPFILKARQCQWSKPIRCQHDFSQYAPARRNFLSITRLISATKPEKTLFKGELAAEPSGSNKVFAVRAREAAHDPYRCTNGLSH